MRYKTLLNWGPWPQGVFLQPIGRTLLNYRLMIPQNLRILSNSANFSTGRPCWQRIVVLDTMASTSGINRLGAVTSLTFLATENMPRQLRIVGRAGGSSWQSYRIAYFATRLIQSSFNAYPCQKWDTPSQTGGRRTDPSVPLAISWLAHWWEKSMVWNTVKGLGHRYMTFTSRNFVTVCVLFFRPARSIVIIHHRHHHHHHHHICLMKEVSDKHWHLSFKILFVVVSYYQFIF